MTMMAMISPVRRAPGRANRGQAGFTLIEVLVAFFVLSIGLLGIVALLGNSKVSQHQAVQRTRAVALADEMIERIRINPTAMATYNIGLTPLGLDASRAEPAPNCSSEECTPVQLAAHDLWEWEKSLLGQGALESGQATSGLIAPTGCIVFVAAAPRARTGQLSVLIQWHGLMETDDALETGDAVCGSVLAGTDDYRRQLAVNTYVVDETEF